MILVRYLVEFPKDDRPSELPADTRAVIASQYEWCDMGQGGITREEVRDDDVQPLGVFPVGSELFVESSAVTDCLDDTDDDTAARTRIWWRVEVVEQARAQAVSPTPEHFDLFAMSVLRSTETGVNGAVIWVAFGDGDDPRIWVVVGDSIGLEELKGAVSVRLTYPPEVLGMLPENVAPEVLAFVEGNRETLLGHWNGELGTRQMLDVLRKRGE